MLTTVTLSFAVLLITVLLTVSVNQRLGEIAALRALGFSRRRVVADVLCGVGADRRHRRPAVAAARAAAGRRASTASSRACPAFPTQLHFFVFEPQALAIHVALLAATAIVAALYPMRIVARLPIAATLRDEVIG